MTAKLSSNALSYSFPKLAIDFWHNGIHLLSLSLSLKCIPAHLLSTPVTVFMLLSEWLFPLSPFITLFSPVTHPHRDLDPHLCHCWCLFCSTRLTLKAVKVTLESLSNPASAHTSIPLLISHLGWLCTRPLPFCSFVRMSSIAPPPTPDSLSAFTADLDAWLIFFFANSQSHN